MKARWLERMIVRHGQVGDWRLSDEDFLRSFRLPTARDKVETLKERHPLARDSRISFDEESHTHLANRTSLSLTTDGGHVPGGFVLELSG